MATAKWAVTSADFLEEVRCGEFPPVVAEKKYVAPQIGLSVALFRVLKIPHASPEGIFRSLSECRTSE